MRVAAHGAWLALFLSAACGDDGGTGGGGVGGGGQGGGNSAPCSVDGDCPASPNPCLRAVCDGGRCAERAADAGVPVPESAQAEGDCAEVVCDGDGAMVDEPDDSDVADDDSDCTTDVCVEGLPSHPPLPSGTACGGAGSQCDGEGACVECLSLQDCTARSNECQTVGCVAGACEIDYAPANSVASNDVEADCHVPLCDGMGSYELLVDTTDTAPDDDPDDCQVPKCDGGAPSTGNAVNGATCFDGVSNQHCCGGICCGGGGTVCISGQCYSN